MEFLKISKVKYNFFIYLIVRIVTIGFKPFLLWYLIYNEYLIAANRISLFFLIVGSIMVFFNNESNFKYYQICFGKNFSIYKKSKEEILYFKLLITHIFIFSFVSFVLIITYTNDVLISIPILLLLILEKVIDEIQRLSIFKKEFLIWSKQSIVKNFLPFFLILILSIFIEEKYLFFIYIVLTILFNALTIYLYIENSKFLKILNYIKHIKILDFKYYFRVYKESLFLNQIQAVSTKNIPLVDRIVYNNYSPSNFAQISLIGQISSLSILFVDYFLISSRRSEYLKMDIKIFELVSIKKTITTFLICIFIFFVSLLAISLKNRSITVNLSLLYIIFSGVYFSLFAISQHFFNFNFWRNKRIYTLLIDLLFYSIILFFYFLFKSDFTSILPYLLFSAHFVRLFFQILLSVNAK
jgi:hypothetical protein